MPRPPFSPVQLLNAYTTTTVALRRQVQAFVAATWGSLDSWRELDIHRFVGQVVPIVTGGQRQVATLTDGYLATMASLVLDRPIRPIGIPPKRVTDLEIRGTDAVEVYGRTGPTVWTALSRGHSLDDAVRQGLSRALATADTDLQLAKTHAVSYATERSDHVSGFERIPDGGACDLCLLASTQRYHSGDLMPIHNRCGCDVEPIFGEHDSGQIINEGLRAKLEDQGVTVYRGHGEQSFYGRVAGNDVGVAVQEHGELGPVLTVAGETFTGPDDI